MEDAWLRPCSTQTPPPPRSERPASAYRLQTVNLLRTALHHPPVGRIIGDTIDALVLSGVLDARLREIAILRVGWRIGAAYDAATTTPLLAGWG